MQLQELIFQGLLGQSRPARIRVEEAFQSLELPSGVSAADVQDLVVLCLYPAQSRELAERLFEPGASIKLACAFSFRGTPLRVVRQAQGDSVRLQRRSASGYEELARGASQVQRALQEKLNLPDLATFYTVHLWRFDFDVEAVINAANFGDDPRIPELAELYLTSLEVESLEDQIKELELRVDEGQRALGEGAELEEKLSRAHERLAEVELAELSDGELELLRERDARMDDYDTQLGRLQAQQDTERRQIELSVPDSPTQMPLFWGAVALALTAFIASFVFHQTHRILALGSIPGLALGAFVLLRYYNNLSKASVHQVRLDSIRRRISQVREDQIMLLERVEHILLHAGVEREEELQTRIPMAQKLRDVIERIEKQLETVRTNPEYRRARRELDSLQAELTETRSRRAELPAFVMNSFQLENDLQTLGADPVEIRTMADQKQAAAQAEDLPQEPLEMLRWVAEKGGLWAQGQLDAGTQAMWSKVCSHVLSERFNGVALSAQGQLQVEALTGEQLELWQRTRSAEVQVVICALALALFVSTSRRGTGGLESVWISDPAQRMTPSHAGRFASVFKSAARQAQIAIMGANA
ncbi:hypothetical protein DL240_08475 [Lujinxingia litoralis]|uniref:Uncharacterized protein n=1 Tax=Lujinxingia litoralis TaxID=2211119 RepID=A0A328CBN5_9DELT|nr:hypothetical protein [Lujinxingia litoralis]RAL22917.1 hypothetical protein DL240_08475 [Lujinxingia litoralis]